MEVGLWVSEVPTGTQTDHGPLCFFKQECHPSSVPRRSRKGLWGRVSCLWALPNPSPRTAETPDSPTRTTSFEGQLKPPTPLDFESQSLHLFLRFTLVRAVYKSDSYWGVVLQHPSLSTTDQVTDPSVKSQGPVMKVKSSWGRGPNRLTPTVSEPLSSVTDLPKSSETGVVRRKT